MRLKDLFKKKVSNDTPIEDKPMFDKKSMLESFPEAYNFNKEYISYFLNTAIAAENHLQAEDAIYGAVPYSHPFIDNKNKSWNQLTQEEQEAKREYSEWRTEKFANWAKTVADQCWSYYNPDKIRSIDESLSVIANFWDRSIFDSIFQDNGSQDEPHGADIMLLGSYMKSKSQKSITLEMRLYAKKLIYEWYKSKVNSGCWYDYLSCDYGPCGNLYEILKRAGINEKNIRNICPWKTWAKIDKVDHSVLVCDGYNNYKTL